jgi:hypothetical protein
MLWTPDTRRGLLRVLAAAPDAGGLLTLLTQEDVQGWKRGKGG